MTPKPFEAHIRHEPGLVMIDLSGKIDAFAEQGLDAVYLQAEVENPHTIVLNFSQVGYINSTGIALIVGLLSRARKSHVNLVVFGLSDHYMEIFRITRLSDFMKVYPDEVSALTASR
jgi:anti-anti-sigma factor